MFRGLPWWCHGWESACQCRAYEFDPWPGKIPPASEQLGVCLEPELRSAAREATAVRKPRSTTRGQPPFATTRESPHKALKTQCSPNK